MTMVFVNLRVVTPMLVFVWFPPLSA